MSCYFRLFHFFSTEWKSYNGPSGPQKDGIVAGSYSQNQYSYVGRGTVFGQLAPGTLLIEDSGNQKAGFYMEHSRAEHFLSSNFEYYAKEQNCDYIWIASSNGAIVANAIEHRSHPYTFYVGRTFHEGIWHVGKVTLEDKTMYFGKGFDTKSYEVLVCNEKPTQIQTKYTDDTDDLTCNLKIMVTALQAEIKLKSFEMDVLVNDNAQLKSKFKATLQENLSLMTRLVECESKNLSLTSF